MNRFASSAQRLAALFVAGCLAFNYPFLALFNAPATLFGVPLLYAYVFGCWAMLIAVMAIVVERAD